MLEDNMNGRITKMVKRQASREARAKLGTEMELLRDIFKPRPKWIPQWIWGLGLSIFIRKGEFAFEPWKDSKPSKIPDELKN